MRIVVGVSLCLVLCGGFTLAGQRLPAEGDPVPSGISKDPTCGFTQENPIRVGRRNGGPRDERIYLAALRGPRGQAVTYVREGSCCIFETPNGEGGKGGDVPVAVEI